MSVFSLPPAKSKEDKYDTIISALSWNDLATKQGRMQSIIRCSIPLHESIYLLFLPYIYLHIYHMVYGPAGQSKMSWTYSLHYVWHFITHPCPSCMLLAILRVLEKQFTLTSGPIKSVTSWLLAGFHDNGGIRLYQAQQNLLKVQGRHMCVGYVMPFQIEIARHGGNSPSGHGGSSH